MRVVKQREHIGNDIYRDVILKMNKLSINTYQICIDLNLEEELVSNYFLGKSKDNLFLGVELLNYLEKKENNL